MDEGKQQPQHVNLSFWIISMCSSFCIYLYKVYLSTFSPTLCITSYFRKHFNFTLNALGRSQFCQLCTFFLRMLQFQILYPSLTLLWQNKPVQDAKNDIQKYINDKVPPNQFVNRARPPKQQPQENTMTCRGEYVLTVRYSHNESTAVFFPITFL